MNKFRSHIQISFSRKVSLDISKINPHPSPQNIPLKINVIFWFMRIFHAVILVPLQIGLHEFVSDKIFIEIQQVKASENSSSLKFLRKISIKQNFENAFWKWSFCPPSMGNFCERINLWVAPIAADTREYNRCILFLPGIFGEKIPESIQIQVCMHFFLSENRNCLYHKKCCHLANLEKVGEFGKH